MIKDKLSFKKLSDLRWLNVIMIRVKPIFLCAHTCTGPFVNGSNECGHCTYNVHATWNNICQILKVWAVLYGILPDIKFLADTDLLSHLDINIQMFFLITSPFSIGLGWEGWSSKGILSKCYSYLLHYFYADYFEDPPCHFYVQIRVSKYMYSLRSRECWVT